jgi:hypothetical protein
VSFRVASFATLLVLGSGCGGSGVAQAPSTPAPPYSWLKPAAAPAGWKAATTPGGAVLAYPPGWRVIPGDPGTASAALTASGGLIVGYLNATPATSSEVPSTWARFRVDHNGEEGDRHVQMIAQAAGLRFRTGTGACVTDSYQTSSSPYTEIACVVRGTSNPTVIVAAATSSDWAAQQAALHTAIDAFRTQA